MADTPLSIPSPSSEQHPAKSIFGYEIVQYLASGAGSTLYYAREPGSKTIRVLKHVVVKTGTEKRFYEQLRNEYLIGRKIDHPGLRRSLELRNHRTLLRGVTEAALILEYREGKSLGENARMSLGQQVCIFLGCADALLAFHDSGYVHCDLKPDNILVHAMYRATIIDLGQACETGTIKTRIQGTPRFMAPEQLRRRALTAQTDIFCFGATMYVVMTGRSMPPVEEPELSETWDTPPHELNPAIPLQLSQLLLDCTQPKAQHRPRDMIEVFERLKMIGKSVPFHSA